MGSACGGCLLCNCIELINHLSFSSSVLLTLSMSARSIWANLKSITGFKHASCNATCLTFLRLRGSYPRPFVSAALICQPHPSEPDDPGVLGIDERQDYHVPTENPWASSQTKNIKMLPEVRKVYWNSCSLADLPLRYKASPRLASTSPKTFRDPERLNQTVNNLYKKNKIRIISWS